MWAILFAIAIAIAIAVPVPALFIREVPLRGAEPAEATPAAAEEIAAQDAEESTAIASSL